MNWRATAAAHENSERTGCHPQKFDRGLGSGQLPQLWHHRGVLITFSVMVVQTLVGFKHD
jgi:hypothetical protein